MFTELPDSVTILFSKLTSSVVPSAFVRTIFPPVKSNVSPWSYSVFVGSVISAFTIPFFTLILNVVVYAFPSSVYVTVTSLSPPVVVNVLKDVNIILLSLNDNGVATPVALSIAISPFVKSYFVSFKLYLTFVGFVNIFIPVTLFLIVIV